MPGGAIVDAARSERLVAGLAVATIGLCALGYAAWPIFPVVVAAATLHAAASCVLGPAIAAISLGLVGPLAIGERFGRNARYASLGNGRCRGRDGHVRLSAVEPLGVSRHLHSGNSDLAGAGEHPRVGNRSRAGARRGGAQGARRQRNQRSESDAPAPAVDLRRQRAAAATRQRGDASDHGGRRNDPLKPVGAGADRRLHHRAASHRRADVAVGRTQGAAMGAPAAAAAGFCRAGDPRRAVRHRERSLSAGRGAGVRRRHRGGVQRHDSA